MELAGKEAVGRLFRHARDVVRPVHALHIYGAVGIAAFGWSLGRWAGFASGRLLPLWLAGALVVYNLDRLKRDPADVFNTPERVRWHGMLRRWSWMLAAAGAAVLVLWPLCIGNGWLLLLTGLGLPLSLSYSFPLLGPRLKDVPVLKTLFAPLVVLAAVLAPPVFLEGLAVRPPLLLAAGWGWALLMFNMVLCDLRDIEGDRAAGTRSVPVLLGSRADPNAAVGVDRGRSGVRVDARLADPGLGDGGVAGAAGVRGAPAADGGVLRVAGGRDAVSPGAGGTGETRSRTGWLLNRQMVDLFRFSNLPLPHGILLIGITETDEATTDPIGRPALARTSITGSRMEIVLMRGMEERERSISIYHEILEGLTVALAEPPPLVGEFNEADFEAAAITAHVRFGFADPQNVAKFLQTFGF